MHEKDEALVRAAAEGRVGSVYTLLREGADVNAAYERGWDALHAAIAAQRYWCVAVLVERGADLNAANMGLTPLALAVDTAIDCSAQCEVRRVPTDIIELLLEAGADPGPGLKVARDYGNRRVIALIEGAVRRERGAGRGGDEG